MEYPVPFRPGIPIPPEPLRYRVTKSPDAAGFHYGGKMTLDYFRDALRAVGRDLPDFHTILDFGCGCGRLTPWLEIFAPHAHLTGCDIDAEAVRWLRTHFPSGDFRTNVGLPPLPFPDVSFDLVIGYSVFTHLDAGYQDAWLAELRRIARPGGTLLLTVNAERTWQGIFERAAPEERERLRAMQAQSAAQGLLYSTDDEWAAHFPDFYHTTWHAHWYIREHWARWYMVREIVEGQADHLHQAIVVLTRREPRWSVGPQAMLCPETATLLSGRRSVAVSWDTGDGCEGQVWVRHAGGVERLFAQGARGAQLADFLTEPGEYVFALYRGTFPSSPAVLRIPVAATMTQTVLVTA